MLKTADRTRVNGIDGVLLRDVTPRRKRFWIFYPNLVKLNFLLFGCLAGWITNGFDQSMLNGLQSVPSWQKFFNKPKGAELGLITAGTRIGAFVSLPLISPLNQKLGRRWTIAIGSSICLIGIILQATARNRAMFIVGRCVLGFGNNIQICTCPILLSELAHPDQRAKITGMGNMHNSLGQIMAAWITYGTSRLGSSSWSWRAPSILQAFTSTVQIIIVLFAPESPRWLIDHGHYDEAKRVITKYHADGDESSPLLHHEMAEIQNNIEMEKLQKTSAWSEYFKTRENIHRFLIVLCLGFIMQWSGNTIVSSYLKLLLDSIGIKDSDSQLLINGGIAISGFVWALLWSCLIDRVGRRKLFLTAMAGMFCVLTTFTALTGVNQTHGFKYHKIANFSVFLIYAFHFFYKIAGPTKDPYIMEITPYRLRAKGATVAQFADTGANLFNGFVNPIGLQELKWKYYLVWCSLLVSHFTIIYLFFPETKNLSLEEVQQMWEGDSTPKDATERDEEDPPDRKQNDTMEISMKDSNRSGGSAV